MNRLEMSDRGPTEQRYLSTAQVAKALGLSVTTVKRWVDDEVLPAHRTHGGHRKLLMADVLRLVRTGHLPQADLSRLDPELNSLGEMPPAEVAARLMSALKAGDGNQARALLHGAYQSGLSIEAIADQVVSPTMIGIGHEWALGRIDVLHEHRGTQLCAAALYELKAQLEANAERDRPVAVGGSPEHDHYFLANLLIQMSLIDGGWDAVNLGPHTPMRSFQTALLELQPRLVWVSVSHLADPDRFLDDYRQFYAAAERMGVAVAVGGRGLTEQLRAAMPYTTFGDGLSQLTAFARTLHPRPRPPRRGRPPGAGKKGKKD
jgi:excisionase family DNA binding protein